MDNLRYKILLSRSSAERSELLQRIGYLRVPLEVIKGKASNKHTRNYLLFIVSIFFAISLYAQFVFPEPYSIFRNTISDQGGIILNPSGYKLWNLGMIFLGVFTIPHFLYLYNILKSLSVVISTLSTALGIICSISMSFVGIFPLDFRAPHLVFAGICFIGIFIKANADLILLIIKRKKQREQKIDSKIPNLIMIGIYYAIFNISFFMMMITYFINDTIVPFWEWVYFIAILIWMLGIYRVK
ncbi:MAG: DUF998 domain-containing protein [Promethearchaeota archaeon]